jgi:formylglycine-generating enzyme required for sulfatase activity
VTWFEAAQYCRWMSEREKLPEEEMCYPPIPEIKPGMSMKPGYLSRTGYRLPTESEWEYACRAGAGTSRHYGVSDAMLVHYAWFMGNSENRAKQKQTWPVGSLKPNDFGLFDMQGNATEWCQSRWVERYASTPEGSAWEDIEDSLVVNESGSYVLKGGSFLAQASDVRSALRGRQQPTLYFDTVGFRIARTRQ